MDRARESIHAAPAPLVRGPFAGWLRVGACVAFLALFTTFGLSGPANAAGSNSAESGSSPVTDPFEKERIRDQAREMQERYRLRVAIPDSARGNVPRAGLAKPANNPPALADQGHNYDVWLGALLCVVGLLAFRYYAPKNLEATYSRLDPLRPQPSSSDSSFQDPAEERAFSEFLVAFKAGPPAKSRTSPSGEPSQVESASPKPSGNPTESNPIEHFFTHAPERIQAARNRFEELGRTADETARPKILGDLYSEFRNLKSMTGLPDLLPAWQLVCTIESFLKQLVAKPSKINPSTLRSFAGGLDVLAALCHRRLDAQFGSNLVPRFLAVDDDCLCRHAVSFALKKAFSQPDVAANGEAALALVSKHSYDAIFLDVLMPGISGFELCRKIHQTPLNPATPVVFVTCLGDSDARAQSSLCGGTDFLQKPFLTFELTLKALTLALQSRLQLTVNTIAPAAPIVAPVQDQQGEPSQRSR